MTERIDNRRETGSAVILGQTWTARAVQDDMILEPGEMGEICAVRGVKLIVKKTEG